MSWADVQVVVSQSDTWAARRQSAHSTDPVAHRDVARFAISRSQQFGKDAQEFVVPVNAARGHARVVILQKSPDLPEPRQVLDLRRRQLAEGDARASIELMIEIECGLGPHGLGRFPNRFAVHQQLQIIRPHLPGSSEQDTEVELPRITVDGQRNGVFRPVSSCPSPGAAACCRTQAMAYLRPRASTVPGTRSHFRFARIRATQSVAPAKSIGIVLVMVEKLLGLVATRSSRTAHRPPWTTVPSTKMVPAGPPPQPRGELPLCSISKLSIAASSDPELGSWA